MRIDLAQCCALAVVKTVFAASIPAAHTCVKQRNSGGIQEEFEGIRVEKEEFSAFACSRHVGFREYVASCGRMEVSLL